MRKLIFLTALISVFSAHAGADFCVAKEESAPYSPFSKITSECNGETIKVSAIFGKDLKKKFIAAIEEKGMKITFQVGDQIVFSRINILNASDLCLGQPSSFITNNFVISCASGSTVTVKSNSPADFVRYLNSYNYKIFQKPETKKGFYILAQ